MLEIEFNELVEEEDDEEDIAAWNQLKTIRRVDYLFII
jgi:hypothetical protein